MSTQVADVEMKNVEGDVRPTGEESKPPKTDALTLADIKEHARLIEKSVSSKEPRFMQKVLMSLLSIRKRLNTDILRKIISSFYAHANQRRDNLLAFIDCPMDTSETAICRIKNSLSSEVSLLPELDVYFHLLVLLFLIDGQRYESAAKCSDLLMQKIQQQNRRSLDFIASKCYFYHSRSYELDGRLQDARPLFHKRLRTVTLKNDSEGQAVLLNCLLRDYLHYNLYDQASKLVSKVHFPESASNNEWARYLYYLGRIQAIQLEYSEAYKNLMQAIRKSPQQTAVGFKQTAYKLVITVQLLLGDIPDRSLFRQSTLRRALLPYYQLTQAVRTGDLGWFGEVIENFFHKFQADHTYSLIVRLRHNVIKAGIRKMNLSYSRISFSDVASKPQLDSPEEAEFIIAKAIRDGVIEASIEHGYMKSKPSVDLCSTREPQAAFHQRIVFCLAIHNEAVKSLRFPPKTNSTLESVDDAREREQRDLEYAKEMADEEDEDFS